MLCYKDVDDVWEQWGSTLSYYETKRIVDASLSAAGGIVLSDFYWSSSERVDYDDRVFDMKFAGGASMWFGGKEGGNWVRLVWNVTFFFTPDLSAQFLRLMQRLLALGSPPKTRSSGVQPLCFGNHFTAWDERGI